MTNGPGKSDRPVVPVKSPNNAGHPAAEGMEGSGLAKGNLPQQNAFRTPSREDALSALERVRQAAKKDSKLRFTALLHHIYNLETLRTAYLSLKKEAAPGVDGETWRHYGETLEENLQDLSHRLKRGAYRAKPVRRVYIDKSDGRKRPLGVPALEDKIVQRATVEVLNAIYETDFLGFFVRIPAGAKPAQRAGCALHRTADEESELGARCGHSQLFRWSFPRMAGEVRRASGGGPTRRAAHPEMAERRRVGGWETNPGGRRDAPGRQCLAVAGQRLSSLCVRSVGPSVASETSLR